MFLKHMVCAEEGVTFDGERKKRVEWKEKNIYC